MKRLVIAISLVLASCGGKPHLDNPGIVLSEPPAELMVPPPQLQTIEEPANGESPVSPN